MVEGISVKKAVCLFFGSHNLATHASIPVWKSFWVCHCLVTTSKLTNKQFSCKFPMQSRLSSMFNLWCVSCVLVCIFAISWERLFSKRIDSFVSFNHFTHFTTFYILSLIHSFQFLSATLRFIYFSVNPLILSAFFAESLFKRRNELQFIWCWTIFRYCSLLSKANLVLLKLWLYVF